MKLLPPFATLEPEPEPEPQVDVGPNASSLDLLSAVYRDPSKPLSVRMRAAIAALPFEHPQLAVVANINALEFASELEAAISRSGKSLNTDGRVDGDK